MTEFATIPEIIAKAKRKLAPDLWDYCSGGAETEATLRRNRYGLDSLGFRTRVLRGVEHRTTKTKFLGYDLDLPVMVAPIGGIARFDPGGALTAAKVTQKFGSATFLSAVGQPSIEDLAEGTSGLKFFQLYAYGDRDWCLELFRRAENVGYDGLCITVDSAVYGRRERDLTNRYRGRSSAFLNFTTHQRVYGERLCWDDVAYLREKTKLPLVLKGIMSAEDARMAVDRGVHAICVSNHGGRELDHQPSTIEVLPEIVRTVDGRAEIIIDSGFQRGTDVLKALALGAKAVLIGKLTCWALSADGEAGLARAFELLREEMLVSMALIGARTVDELNSSCLREVTPV